MDCGPKDSEALTPEFNAIQAFAVSLLKNCVGKEPFIKFKFASFFTLVLTQKCVREIAFQCIRIPNPCETKWIYGRSSCGF